ncbi:rod shape-determining protein MreC [Streptococcus suis]|nr:rod shape-determining protein MreC [Streptococcus suis]
MNKFSKFIIAFSVFLLLSFSLLFLSTNSSPKLLGVQNVVNSVVSPFQTFFSLPTRFFSNQKTVISDLISTYEENRMLRQSLQSLESSVLENSSLKAENESLRSSLAMSSKFSDKNYLVASVLVRSPSSWSEKLTVNIGVNKGVKVDDLVVSNGGIIGIVSSTSSDTSEVTLLTNADVFTKLPVKFSTSSGNVYGILSSYDSDTNSFVVNQLSSTDEISTSTEVVTSDLAGATPANVLVGVVKSVKSSSNKLNREILVEPSANFSNIYSVLVVGTSNE